MEQVVAAQAEEVLEMYPRGSRALSLLAVGRSLASRFMDRPGVGRDELLAFLRDVDALLGPIYGPSFTDDRPTVHDQEWYCDVFVQNPQGHFGCLREKGHDGNCHFSVKQPFSAEAEQK